jgi:hypothetical protein
VRSEQNRFAAALMVIIGRRQNLSGARTSPLRRDYLCAQLPLLIGIATVP